PTLAHGTDSQSPDSSRLRARKNSTALFLSGPAASIQPIGGCGLGIQESPMNIKEEFSPPKSHEYRNSDTSSVAAPSRTCAESAGNWSLGGMVTPPPSETALSGERSYLNSPEEVFYMQVFVEEVGVWMDSM